MQACQSPSKVTVAELLQQLTVTQAELENIKVRCDLFIIYESLALTNTAIQRHSRLIEKFIRFVQDERFSITINIEFQIEYYGLLWFL